MAREGFEWKSRGRYGNLAAGRPIGRAKRPMRYYHNEAARAVYAEPDKPTVVAEFESRTKRRRHPKRLGCKVWMTVEVTRADNWIDPTRNQWAHPVRQILQENYDDRDSDS